MTSTTSAYLAVSQNLPRYQAMTATEPAVKTATAYYEANIGSVTSIKEFVGNYRLLSYALDAYGLGDQIDARALVTKVLEGGVSNPRSLANTLGDSRWKAFAAAFNFGAGGAASPSSAAAVKTTADDYLEQQLEERPGDAGRGRAARALFRTRRADRHQRIWRSGRSESAASGADDPWALARGRQHAAGADALRTHAALRPAGPAKLKQLTERFTAMYDLTYGPGSGATTDLTVDSGNTSSGESGAAAVLADVISSNGLALSSALNAFTGAPAEVFSTALLSSLQRFSLGG